MLCIWFLRLQGFDGQGPCSFSVLKWPVTLLKPPSPNKTNETSHGTAGCVEEDVIRGLTACPNLTSVKESSGVMLLFYLWPLKFRSSSPFLAQK